MNLPVGDPGRDEVALGPLIDAGQRDKVHGLVSSTVDAGGRLAADTEYGLSLGILTRDPLRALALADRLPSGIVHINDQTFNDTPTYPLRTRSDLLAHRRAPLT